MSVRSFKDLRNLNIKVVDGVQVTRAGSHYKARLQGHANFVFGTTVEQAKQRLQSAIAKRWGIVPRPITIFEKKLMQACK